MSLIWPSQRQNLKIYEQNSCHLLLMLTSGGHPQPANDRELPVIDPVSLLAKIFTVLFRVAANLNERDWSVITRTNCLLSGYKLAFEPKPAKKNEKGEVVEKAQTIPIGVERSPYNGI